ncbi:RNA polymerase subunit sigma-70 [Roseovarius spongiae]|uniref:RNA polymerase subunit sigma-70 n=1 Tax=Roseovarius spongiae TaxID=2320272 RepID=A0A3A8AW46_9RHOB|nr:NepR family anti-sigma factor [Roseovarius spongiae]RKF14870.1 RNA polymerase subunit sigma-70 [Roseovarius spongiae]
MATEKRGSRLDQEIDRNLQRVYKETIDEEVPDRFTRLLQQLKESEAGASPKEAEDGQEQ